jgi:hypothetical protein
MKLRGQVCKGSFSHDLTPDRPSFVATVGLAALIVLGFGWGSAWAGTKLFAQVGPGARTITFKTADGKTVSRLRAGRYTIVVRDRSRTRNFHLAGPAGGLNRKTTAKFVGLTTWTVRLTKGVYQYLSDSNPNAIRSFSVR